MRKSLFLGLVALVIACNAALGVTITGTSSFFGLTSGTSGGIPYFSSASTAASSAALGVGAIVLGGGAGASPTASACTIDSNPIVACSSLTSQAPEVVLTNATSDALASFLFGQKSRGGGAVNSGDALFTIQTQGVANSANRNAAGIAFSVAAAPSGNNVPSKIFFNITDAAGTASAGMTLDNNDHLNFTSAGVPALTSCGTGSPTVRAGSTDVAGELTEGTSASGCTLTFKVAYSSAPFCAVTSQTQLAAFTYAVATGTIIITNTSTTGDKINWVCHGA